MSRMAPLQGTRLPQSDMTPSAAPSLPSHSPEPAFSAVRMPAVPAGSMHLRDNQSLLNVQTNMGMMGGMSPGARESLRTAAYASPEMLRAVTGPASAPAPQAASSGMNTAAINTAPMGALGGSPMKGQSPFKILFMKFASAAFAVFGFSLPRR